MKKLIIPFFIVVIAVLLTLCSKDEEECKICTPSFYNENDSLLRTSSNQSQEFCGDELKAKQSEKNVDPDGNYSIWECSDY